MSEAIADRTPGTVQTGWVPPFMWTVWLSELLTDHVFVVFLFINVCIYLLTLRDWWVEEQTHCVNQLIYHNAKKVKHFFSSKDELSTCRSDHPANCKSSCWVFLTMTRDCCSVSEQPAVIRSSSECLFMAVYVSHHDVPLDAQVQMKLHYKASVSDDLSHSTTRQCQEGRMVTHTNFILLTGVYFHLKNSSSAVGS